ncbi:ABC transporter ATP-binding protein [Streptomyces sp. SID3343]|uniref:ABC transporter ATP-binding protein n=1 Tax=Streptomyces sp. SID3343 TaxID=2690260 RepID=UPI001370A813|nr:ABC transporter ATP-binding protein [Streptomyces sp. SID3343]MYW03795.1 ATP-binding cassette domain-containing protein [Streptomyces sp. SID3343]
MTITVGERTTAPAVALAGVSKAFGDVRAVDGLDLELRQGETVALLGPNGAGKSTTLDLLLGLSRPTQGSVALFGGDPRDAIRGGRVGAMLQSGGLMPDVTVGEMVGLARDLHPRPLPQQEVLRRAGIEDLVGKNVGKLSGGQAQRVRFAVAIAGEVDLIVLDEPTTGMDVDSRQRFWESMREQAELGRTVLFATHYLEEADNVADRVLVLHRGRLLADASAAQIKARAGLRRVAFELDRPVEEYEPTLRALPGIAHIELSGTTVRIRSDDADETVAAIYAAGFRPRGLEVAGLGLEQAFLAITQQADEAQGMESSRS